MEIFAFQVHKLGMLSCVLWWGKAGAAVWLQEPGILHYTLIAAKLTHFCTEHTTSRCFRAV